MAESYRCGLFADGRFLHVSQFSFVLEFITFSYKIGSKQDSYKLKG
jgi:hypothetical protein